MAHVQITAICLGTSPLPGKDPVQRADLGRHGLLGDRHATKVVHVRGKEVFNERQWSAVSEEEVGAMEEALGVTIPVGALGENFRFSGEPALSQLPFGTRFRLPSGAVLLVSGQNFPCQKQSDYLAAILDLPALRRSFIPAVKDLRGVVGWVEAKGPVSVGDRALIELP